MPRTDWRAIAEELAGRVAIYAACDAHDEESPDPECPFCLDRAAYQHYLDAGGPDVRPPDASGPSLSLAEIRQAHSVVPPDDSQPD